MNQEEQYPHSAISSWSGFVYQGKIALYHTLALMLQDDYDFDLQLDSTEDFAIYKAGVLISAHQVKAKIGKYRSDYSSALQKAGEISGDRIRGSIRYIHVSVEISDVSDFIAPNGEIVKFYSYNENKYCGLGDIEELTKQLILKICESRQSIMSEKLIKTNYCIASEKISSQAIEIHRKNQVEGISENKAAYTFTIKASDILEDILNNNPCTDIEYFSLELKNDLYNHLEARLDLALPAMSNNQYLRFKKLFEHIYKLESDDLRRLCQLIKPSEQFSKIQRMDVNRYFTLIQKICIDPAFSGIPHYADKHNNFYLPTAISLNNEEESLDCISQIEQETKNNKELLFLLFEYGNLIAAHSPSSFFIESKITDIEDLNDLGFNVEEKNNIIKELNINIITVEDVEEKLNA